jgi:membrane protein involved in D-alanine export
VAPATTAGFLGLSYVTFRALDVLIGIHDGLVKALPPGRHLAYLLFFPTLSSGPIDRWARFDADLSRPRDRAAVVADAGEAVRRVALGLLLKFVLAALVQRWWLEPAARAAGPAATASYMYAYSAFLYLDFAGYSHMAIGVSRLFGIRTPENFDQPWRATSIADFWNRWHMSLSFWFRDHVYMRVVLAAKRHRWPLSPIAASSLGFLVTFLLMGAWHGLAWHYIAYGLYHAALLSGHQALSRRAKGRAWRSRGPAWRAAGIALTVQLVCFGFLIFSGRLG